MRYKFPNMGPERDRYLTIFTERTVARADKAMYRAKELGGAPDRRCRLSGAGKGDPGMRNGVSAFLIAVAVLVFGPVAARSEVTGFGIKAGVAMSNIFGRDVYDQRFRAGFTYGIFMTYGIGRTFAVQPELLFVMKGSKYVNGRGSDAYRETMNLEYVELPILAKFYLPFSRAFRIHVFAGPAPALNIRARVDARFAGEFQEETLDNVMGFDIGLAAGAGIEVPVGRGRITFDARYTAGLTTLSKESDDDIRNGAVSLLFGYMF